MVLFAHGFAQPYATAVGLNHTAVLNAGALCSEGEFISWAAANMTLKYLRSNRPLR